LLTPSPGAHSFLLPVHLNSTSVSPHMLNHLLTSAFPSFVPTKQGRPANGNHLLRRGLRAQAGTDGVGPFATSCAVIPPHTSSQESRTNSLQDPLPKTVQATPAWQAAVPHARAGRRRVFRVTPVNNLTNTVTRMTT